MQQGCICHDLAAHSFSLQSKFHSRRWWGRPKPAGRSVFPLCLPALCVNRAQSEFAPPDSVRIMGAELSRGFVGVRYLGCNGGSSSVAERQLPKLNVAGSIPVSRSNKINKLADGQPKSMVQIWSTFSFQTRNSLLPWPNRLRLCVPDGHAGEVAELTFRTGRWCARLHGAGVSFAPLSPSLRRRSRP